MTSTSKYGYYITPLSAALGADYPMDTATTRWCVNNARHLIDESAQTRVNFCCLGDGNMAGNSTDGYMWSGDDDEWFNVKTFVFPISIIGADTGKSNYNNPVNLVVSVWGYVGGYETSGTLYIRTVIQPANRSYDDDFVDDQCLAYLEGNTASSTPVEIIDDYVSDLYPVDIRNQLQPSNFYLSEHDSKTYDVKMFMARLTIHAKIDVAVGGSAYGHLTHVHAREFQK